MAEQILFVDDEQYILDGISRRLGRKYKIITANSGQKGLEVFKSQGPFPVVVSDMQMPEMNGIEFLQKIRELSKDTICMMLTGNADQKTAVDAINEGSIFRFYTKPCEMTAMEQGIEAALKQYTLLNLERDLLERTLAGSVKLLVDILTIFDPDVFSKTRKMRSKIRQIAMGEKLKFSWDLDMAIMLSPLGRVLLPLEITTKLNNDRCLTNEEFEIVERAPETAHKLLGSIPRLEKVADHILYQNKGFDGSGFPKDDVSGADIPLGARLIRILNDLDATAKNTDSIASAFSTLKLNKALYDPQLLEVIERSECLPPQIVERETTEVNVGSVRAGDKLVSNVRTDDGILILSAGLDLSQVDIERLTSKARLYNKIKNFVVSREKGKIY